MLCALRNQVAPYENEKGAADKMVDLWVERLGRVLLAGKAFLQRQINHSGRAAACARLFTHQNSCTRSISFWVVQYLAAAYRRLW